MYRILIAVRASFLPMQSIQNLSLIRSVDRRYQKRGCELIFDTAKN